MVLTLSSPGLAGVQVLLLPGPAVLEPDLRHPLAQPGDLGDPLQVLPVRVRVDLEVGLQDLDLLLRERRPHPLRLLLVVALRLVALCWNLVKETVDALPHTKIWPDVGWIFFWGRTICTIQKVHIPTVKKKKVLK